MRNKEEKEMKIEKKNLDLKFMAYQAGLTLWQIAREMGIADTSLSRKLRYDLSDSDRRRFIDAVEKLSGEKR